MLPALDITAETIEEVAKKLQGGAGPSGVHSLWWEHWMLRVGARSEKLREAVAALARVLANDVVPWQNVRALVANRLIALDKCPGVRPIGVGECLRRIIGKAVMVVAGVDLKVECGADQLCASLEAGIEGAVHAMCTEFDKADCGWGVLMVDAANAFNALNRKAALWHARHLWPAAARYLYNTYKGWAPLILANSVEPLYSMEGTTQGDPMSMAFYAVGLLPLIRIVKREETLSVSDVLQMWYADDSSGGGSIFGLVQWLRLLTKVGPAFGYFPEPDKSVLVVQPSQIEAAQRILKDEFHADCPKVVTDHRLLGGHLGDVAGKRRFVSEKVEKWVALIGKLADIAVDYPQAAYTAMTRSVQCEWQYVQRTVMGCGPWFEPVEQALSVRFLPALLRLERVSPEMRQLFALPVKFGGLGLPDPTRTADDAYATSCAATAHLREAIKGLLPLRLPDHQAAISRARAEHKAQKAKTCETELPLVLAELPDELQTAVQRAITHKTGAWLSVMPTARNGNKLCAAEWRDGIAFRYGTEPMDLQPRCDGCGQEFDADHALKCRKGGLIIRRHNDVCGELQRLTEMNWPGTVLEPIIRHGNSSLPDGHPERDGLVGDLLVRGGVHTPQKDAILDVQVIYLDAPSRARRNQRKRGRPKKGQSQVTTQNSDTEGDGVDGLAAGLEKGQEVEEGSATGAEGALGGEGGLGGGAGKEAAVCLPDRATAILRTQEKVKELKHKTACESTRRDFVPFIVSTDGCIGEAAQAFLKRLGQRLAEKWQRSYSQVMGFVKARMSVAILRASSQCLRGPRTRVQGAVCVMEDGAALGVAKL